MTNYPAVITNTGLGDFYVISGALVFLARKYGGIVYPALPQYTRTIRLCLSDHPEIQVIEVLDDFHMLRQFRDVRYAIRAHWTDMGQCERETWVGISSDEWQYQKLGVPFAERWDSCPLEAAAGHQVQIVFPGPYYLLHEDPERGFPITYPPWHPAILTRRVGKYGTHTPLGWVDAIRRARELHFIDSSMWHLANSITLRREQPRYLHRYVRSWHPTWHAVKLRDHWEYLDGTPTPYIRAQAQGIDKDKDNEAIRLNMKLGLMSTETGTEQLIANRREEDLTRVKTPENKFEAQVRKSPSDDWITIGKGDTLQEAMDQSVERI